MREAFKDLVETARVLVRSGRTLAVFFATYVALLATLTLFILTREATVKDLLVTLATLIIVPALFFLLQAMCVSYDGSSGVREVVKNALGILRRLVIVTVPFLVIGIASYVILGKVDAQFSPSLQGKSILTLAQKGESWSQVVISAIRLVVFGIVFPLACIHAWIAIRSQGVRQVLSSFKPIMSRAFALRSLKTYVIGFSIFGILPYILISVRTPSDRAWLEISLLSIRLVLAFGLMLFGWIVTVGALQRGSMSVRTWDE